VTFLDPTIDPTSTGLLPIIALLIDASADELRFQFVHGMVNNPASDEALPSTAGRQLGYAIEGQNLLETSPNIDADNAYSVRLTAVPSVPEPATWLAMLLGFGAIGLAFRRNRRSLAPAF
jgi:hypothetical protein